MGVNNIMIDGKQKQISGLLKNPTVLVETSVTKSTVHFSIMIKIVYALITTNYSIGESATSGSYSLKSPQRQRG